MWKTVSWSTMFTQTWEEERLIKGGIWNSIPSLISVIQREILVRFYFKDAADAFVSFLSKAEDDCLFPLRPCKQKCLIMRSALLKICLITWIAVAGEAQIGKTEGGGATARDILICFLLKTNKQKKPKNPVGQMRHCSTDTSSVGLCDCCMRKLDVLVHFFLSNRA